MQGREVTIGTASRGESPAAGEQAHISAPLPQVCRLAVFGSTGSIGRNTLEVVADHSDRLTITALSTHSRVDEALDQCARFQPRWLIITCPEAAARVRANRLPAGVELLVGSQYLGEIAAAAEVDTLVSAIVGIAGLPATWSAVAAGKRVALANKETLVAAGPLIQQLARQSGAEILPVDSEHSAIFQAMQAGRADQVRRIFLTASGGPFRNHSAEQLRNVSVSQALQHPTWKMGRKISVDSATMMNKALEIIEARWLFNISPEQIEVWIHPQSIVHSMVEFRDGSVVAQLSPPDMRLPIQYALSYPERWSASTATWSLPRQWNLEFEAVDLDRFPAVELGFQAARDGGTSGVVLNAANEAAVESFLAERLAFRDIVPACRSVVERHPYHPQPDLKQLFALDTWAREEIARWIGS